MIEIPKAYIAKKRSQNANVFNNKEVKDALQAIYKEIRVANRQGSFGCRCKLFDLYEYAITEIQVYLESLGYDTEWDHEEGVLLIAWENAQPPEKEEEENVVANGKSNCSKVPNESESVTIVNT